MARKVLKFSFIMTIILACVARSYGQSPLPDVFVHGTISDQFKYLDDRARIYDGYRAIREDMYETVGRNTLDTLKKAKTKISGLLIYNIALNNRIDSLKNSLNSSKVQLKRSISTKNSIRVMGIDVDKKLYNSVTWIIIISLLFLLGIGYLTFRQNRSVTVRTKRDLTDVKEEFEAYRQKARLEREQMTRDHFNEIKKLKEK